MHLSLYYLVSISDEEFNVLGEDDLTLLSRQLQRLYMNRKNARRSSGMCYRCGKHGNFIVECLKAMKIKAEHKHRPRTDHKHHSRNDYKGKNKSERRPRKSGVHKKKTERAMIAGASDIDSSSCYTSSSSSDEEEVDRHKSKRSSKIINGLCFTAQGFYGMTHSSERKKIQKDDSDSDSEDEVNNDRAFLITANARFNDLLGNRDDVLRKANKEKREYSSLLGEAQEKVIELEFMLVNARFQIDSLKSAPIVTDEPECNECSVFHGDLTVLREKYASKVEKLDVARVELDEMRSRLALLGACTSCPVLHAKLVESVLL
jgi:hypothetical protein